MKQLLLHVLHDKYAISKLQKTENSQYIDADRALLGWRVGSANGAVQPVRGLYWP